MDISGSEYYEVNNQAEIDVIIEDFRLIVQEALTVDKYRYELEISFRANRYRK